MSSAKPWQACQLLIFLNQSFGFAGDFLGGNFDLDLALDVFFGFRGAHVVPFALQLRVFRSLKEAPGSAWLLL